MKERCNNPNHSWYKNYWAKWIKVEWDNYLDFRNDMYDSYCTHEEKYWLNNSSIDRIDSNKNYNKENCRRATMLEQNNNLCTNHPVDYNGKHYNTISSLCRDYWVKYDLVIDRLRNGRTIDKAIKTPVNDYIEPVFYLWEKYKSLWELCRKVWVINEDIARDRIKRGRSLEKAVTTPKLRSCKYISVEYKWKKYPSIERLCKDLNLSITPSRIRMRLSQWMDIVKAIETPVKNTTIIFEWKEYPTLKALCAEKNVWYRTTKSRIFKLWWSIEDAIYTPLLRHKNKT